MLTVTGTGAYLSTMTTTTPEAEFWAEWDAGAEERTARIAASLAELNARRRASTGVCFGRTGETTPPRGGGPLRIAAETEAA